MKFAYASLSIVVVTIGIVLFRPQETPVLLLSSKSIHSIYQSDVLETFTIPIASTYDNHIYTDVDFIVNARIHDDQYTFPLTVKRIDHTADTFIYDTHEYFIHQFVLTPEIESPSLYLHIEQAMFELTYENGDVLDLSIGEFNYLTEGTLQTHLTFTQLSSTHQRVNGIDYITGIGVEIVNRTNEPITLETSSILSSFAQTPKMYLSNSICEGVLSPSECIGEDELYPLEPPTIELLGKQSVILYIPVDMDKNHYLHRAALTIDFSYQNDNFSMIIDDFPFIRTSIFDEAYQPYFSIHEPDTN